MNRLTRLESSGIPVYVGQFKEHDEDIAAELNTSAAREILFSLALYENTGLDPIEVAEQKWEVERLWEKLHYAYQSVDSWRQAYERLSKFVTDYAVTAEALKPPQPIVLQYPKGVTPCAACRKKKECDFHRMGLECCCDGDPEIAVEDVSDGV